MTLTVIAHPLIQTSKDPYLMLLDYLEEKGQETSIKEVHQKFLNLDFSTSGNLILVQLALRCQKVSAAVWLYRHEAALRHPHNGKQILKRSSSINGKSDKNHILVSRAIRLYCPQAAGCFPDIHFIGTRHEGLSMNAFCNLFIGWTDQEKVRYAEEYGVRHLTYRGMPLLNKMVSEGNFEDAKLLIRYGAIVDNDTRQEYQESKKKDVLFYYEYLGNPFEHTVLYEDISKKDEESFEHHLSYYGGKFNGYFYSDSESTVIPLFLLVLRTENESMVIAFLEAAKKSKQNILFPPTSTEAKEICLLANSFSSSLRGKLLKIAGATETPSTTSEDRLLRRSSSRSRKKTILNISVQEIFSRFHLWKVQDQSDYILSNGLDNLMLGEQSLLMEMIQRLHWEAAEQLVICGAEVNAKVFKIYEKVQSDNPSFKGNVLERASEKCELVKCCRDGINSKKRILAFLAIFQGNFNDDLIINNEKGPLYYHLLNFRDQEIGMVLAERMKQLNLSAELTSDSRAEPVVLELKRLYSPDLPIQIIKK